MAQAKKTNVKRVVRTAKKTTAKALSKAQLTERLTALAVEYTTTEHVKALREEAKKVQGSKYSAVFELAQASRGRGEFDVAADGVKATMKAAKQNIDRTYSNAVSAVRRYWTLIADNDGMVVHIGKARTEVKVRKSLKQVETFNMLKEVAEAIRKAKEAEETQGTTLPRSLADKRALLLSKLEHVAEDTANAALDAALAHFIVGGEATHKKPAGENAGENKQTVRAKATRTATRH